ncbi:Delta-1-pyrroline-5-carboxylate dehydrogenase, mitochondrial [Galdieria sulphuraria]|nr:Delta-1-pyrroline-5-carboxylate dehydrogenase, mitochondrial [Galdieria sulphuraria]
MSSLWNFAVRHTRLLFNRNFSNFSIRAKAKVPPIHNEPFLDYAVGSPERINLRKALEKIGKQQRPDKHQQTICEFEYADHENVEAAIRGALKAKKHWETMPIDERLSIFLKAADLLSTQYRAEACAAVMLGQGKTVWQAEIDAAVETIDFWRFGCKFAEEIYNIQPPENVKGVWNRAEHRPLEGFVAAITPFNFVAIAANLPSSPAIMGNVAVWKPTESAMLGAWTMFNILREAGLPDGVIQFVPAKASDFAKQVTHSEHLGGLHFTGSTAVFEELQKKIAQNMSHYRSYPRVVGETGGKNFHFVHESADIENVVHNTIRGAFEYQGQKCSATSPEAKTIKVGSPVDFTSFMTAVIHERSFDKIQSYIQKAKESSSCKILFGGRCDKSVGYFIEPTIIETTDPDFVTMKEEIFGPVVTVYAYDPKHYVETLELADSSSKYGLTASIFAKDRDAISKAEEVLRNSAGNFYINDKCTGSIVGQQPFGGSRKSGTNDKSGSASNLMRWVSVRSIKESFIPLKDYRYPHMVSDQANEEVAKAHSEFA